MILFKCLARLPWGVLYALSDVFYFVMRYLIRYRRKVVRQNIRDSFPDETPEFRKKTEKDFYHHFCDVAVELIKLLHISNEEMKERMVFVGVDEMAKDLDTHPVAFLYLGHYCNWEWISSWLLWAPPHVHQGQLYRPMNQKTFESFFQAARTRFGAENIDKNVALRRIIELKNQGIPSAIGFIADQSPKRNSIHKWIDFLNHPETPVFTGAERIAKKVNAAIWYADIERLSRGHYKCTVRRLVEDVNNEPEHHVTELFMQALEKSIRRQPGYWLWSHKRWKRTKENDI